MFSIPQVDKDPDGEKVSPMAIVGKHAECMAIRLR
jgi:hypothetical protein